MLSYTYVIFTLTMQDQLTMSRSIRISLYSIIIELTHTVLYCTIVNYLLYFVHMLIFFRCELQYMYVHTHVQVYNIFHDKTDYWKLKARINGAYLIPAYI